MAGLSCPTFSNDFTQRPGIGLQSRQSPLHLVVQIVAALALCAGWFLRDVFGDLSPDATTQAYSEVGLDMWPPVRRRI